ncbi:MAG TPA: hypothetical protein VNR87_18100 [Flavisolibacter sp.]|nr:hypothetical protein [Flavisolibacter sp.]
MTVDRNSSTPYIRTLAVCLNKIITEGYTENFKLTEEGLEAQNKQSSYTAEQVNVVNSFRFEAQSDPNDNVILYVIETNDGTRGTLIQDHVFRDAETTQFMKRVQTVQKPS